MDHEDVVTASFDTRRQADDAVARLRDSGFDEVRLSLRAVTNIDDTVDFVDPDVATDNMLKGSDMGIAASGHVYGTDDAGERYLLMFTTRRDDSADIKTLLENAGARRVDIHRR